MMRNGRARTSEAISSLTNHIRRVLTDRGFDRDTPGLIACSGGRDSVVLTDAVVTAGYRNVAIAHVDHGIRAASERAADRELVTGLARKLCVPVHFRAIPPGTIVAEASERDESVEAVARHQRYRELQKMITIDGDPPEAVLFTAHHDDDVAETVLMRVLSGRSPFELLGIEAETVIDGMRVLRPLIGVSRTAVSQYATDRGLSWCEDSTNADDAYLRNFIRHAILPEISRRFPMVSNHVVRFHREHRELRYGLEELIPPDAWGEITSEPAWSVNRTVYSQIPRAAREIVLRRAHKMIVPGMRSSFRPVFRIVEEMLHKNDFRGHYAVTAGKVEILLTKDLLSLKTRIVRPAESGYLLEVPDEGCIHFWPDTWPTGGRVEDATMAPAPSYLSPVMPPVVVRGLQAGDRLVIAGVEQGWNQLFRRRTGSQPAVRNVCVIEDARGMLAMVRSSADYIVRDGVSVRSSKLFGKKSVCLQFND